MSKSPQDKFDPEWLRCGPFQSRGEFRGGGTKSDWWDAENARKRGFEKIERDRFGWGSGAGDHIADGVANPGKREILRFSISNVHINSTTYSILTLDIPTLSNYCHTHQFYHHLTASKFDFGQFWTKKWQISVDETETVYIYCYIVVFIPTIPLKYVINDVRSVFSLSMMILTIMRTVED